MVGHDAMSFIEFIIALRRILADHPSREDILDGHKFLNLYSTREHPLLAKIRPRQPERWLHVKLQVEEKGKVSWTALVMRGDNLYVLGFFNQSGVLYKLLDDKEKSKGHEANGTMNLKNYIGESVTQGYWKWKPKDMKQNVLKSQKN